VSSTRRKKADFGAPKVPAYLVSFGDMMTILLTFFILLCTYAKEKQHGFISDGIGSFRLAIEALGLPGFLTSDRYPVDLGRDRIRYQTRDRGEQGGDPDPMRVDDELETLARAGVSDLALDAQVRIGLPIRFAPGTDTLLPGSEGILRHIAGLVDADGRCVEIIGHADREALAPTARDRLALRRAARIVTLLHEEYDAPCPGLTAATASRSRAEDGGSIPDGDITLRLHRPERVTREEED
jgi:hypothetical protein